jgi:hypothetical protein
MDGIHVSRTARDFQPWFKSFKAGECAHPAFGFPEAEGALTPTVRCSVLVSRCQDELVEVALQLG